MAERPRRPRWRTLVEGLIVVVLFLGVRAYMQRGMVSGMAPEIQGRLLSGAGASLSEMRGEPVIVHFWASWCGVCRREAGTIASLAREYPVLTVATRSGDAAAVRRYLAAEQVSFPVILDPGGEIASKYGVRALPTTFVLDAEGRIRFAETGYTTGIGLRVRRWLAD